MKKNRNKVEYVFLEPDVSMVPKTPVEWSHRHDFTESEIWGTYHYIARSIVPRLKAFKACNKHGYCPDMKDMKEWNNTIQKMIDAFEIMQGNSSSYTEEEMKTISTGLNLFCKYYLNLWD